jgi:hypothetical protein
MQPITLSSPSFSDVYAAGANGIIHTLVVIDAAVQEGDKLAAAVQRGRVLQLRSGEGIAEITQALRPETQQLMIVAHGEAGVLHLGGAAITAEQLYGWRSLLQAWTVEEIVLCSCEIDKGRSFTHALTQLTGSRVIASAETLGVGNWLPQMWDLFEAKVLQSYSGLLNVTSVTSGTPDGSYGMGGTVEVTINFSEPLTLAGGNLILTLDTGAMLTITPFTSQNSATQTYTVAAGQVSGDLNVTTISLDGGATLRNGGGVDATLTIPAGQALKDSKAIVIDGVAPFASTTYNGFRAQSTFAAGSRPGSVSSGDLDGDGDQDLAIANVNSSGTVSVLLSNGSGGFSARTTFAVGSSPFSVSMGDVDGDGDLDLAIANISSNTVSVLLGNGSGGFSAQTTFAVGSSPYSVSMGDVDGDGDLDLAIANRSSNTVSVLLGNGSGGFSARTTFATGTNPRSVSMGDLDGDGDLDLAIANYSSNTVSVLLGNGSGGFSAQITFATGSSPYSVSMGDVDGDGDLDLAIANNGSSNVSVLLGNGSGGFSAQTTLATGTNPISVSMGDFNGDGRSDLAIANLNSNTVSILLNNPIRAIAPPVNGTYTAGEPLTFTVNFNEAVTVTGTPILPLTIGSTPVNATYVSGSGTPALTFTYTVALGNIDLDGIAIGGALSGGTIKDAAGNNAVLTLPVVNTSGIRVNAPITITNITSPHPNGTYTTGTTIPITLTFAQPVTLTGNLILTLNSGATLTVTSFSGTATTVNYPIAAGQGSNDLDVTAVALGSGASLKDANNNNVSLATLPKGINSLAGSKALVIDSVAPMVSGAYNGFGVQSTFAVGIEPSSVSSGDFNGDSKADLAIANNGSSTVSVLLGNGSGGFSAQTTFATGFSPISVSIGDVDGDGDLDLAIANFFSNTVSVLLGNGSGGFSAQTALATGSYPGSVSSGDFNGDGRADLAIANISSSNVSVLLGNGSGGFSAQTTFATGTSPYSVSIGDFNGDDKADLAIANANSNNVSVLLSNGSGGFSAQSTFAAGSRPSSVSIGDFNGDDKADLAIANLSSNNVSVVLGNGSGGFSAQTTFAVGSSPYSVSMGDVDGDGDLDLAIANGSSNTVSVLRGNGSGGFSAQTTFATGTTPRSVSIGDFNGDSRPDLAIANFTSNNVSILLNTPAPAITPPTNGTYIIGQPLTFTVNFNEVVTVTGTPALPLTLGSTPVNATYQSGSGSTLLTFRYTIASGDQDTNGIAIGSALLLNGGTIKDAMGNNAVLTLPVVNTSGILVDAVPPTVAITLSDSALIAGDTATVTFTFNKIPTGFTATDVTVQNGSLSGFTVTADPKIYTALFTPTANIEDTTNVITVANTYTDALGNPGTANTSANYTIDTKVPTVAITLSDSALIAGDTATVIFTFSEAPSGFTNADVTVENGTLSGFTVTADPKVYTATFTPTANIEDATNIITVANTYTDAAGNTGTAGASANYTIDTKAPTVTITLSDSALIAGETTTVTFTFNEALTGFTATDVTVQNGTLSGFTVTADPKVYTATFTPTVNIDDATNLITVANTYTDLAGNPGTANTSSNYTVATIVPTLTAITSTTANGTYGTGSPIALILTFSEPVTLANGSLNLTLNSGATVTVNAIANSNSVTIPYTVAPGEDSSDLDVTAIALTPSATLKDASGNAANLTLPTGANSLAGSKAIVIDAIIPAIASLTSTTPDGTYGIGKSVNLTVNFSKPVTLAGGNLTLTLDTGATVTIAPFNTSTTATATYTVATGQTSPDLNITTLTLDNGATLRDAANNPTNLSIPTGEALSDNQAIVIGRSAPTLSGSPAVSIAEDTAYNFTPTAVDPDPETLVFSITNKPSWATFDTATGKLSGTPTNANIGTTQNVTISVSDGVDTVSLNAFNLTVTNVNDPPTIGTPILLTANQSPIALQPFSFTIPPTAFTDADPSDPLNLTVTLANGAPLPTWLQFNPQTLTLSGTPTATDVGNLDLKLTATDRTGAQVSQNFSLPIALPTGETGVATPVINFAGGKKGITKTAAPGKLLQGTKLSDVLRGTKGNDRIKSGKKSDRLGNDKLYGLEGNDRLFGGGGKDLLDGGKGDDTLNGSKGRDLLLGGDGKDKLFGGEGEDILVGGQGNDVLTGGTQKDMFTFGSVNDGVDTITDFNVNEDVLDLRVIFNQPQYSGATPYARYLQYVKLVQVGSNTEVRLDQDGNGGDSTFTTLATLQNVAVGAIAPRHFVIS